ncbi:MAG: substrate-binding domain-containing protein [Gemmatimonadetes bacterium]|nr:substrate-binding domain-containing protein [Gemmatimonadota bacterium]MDE2736244.1 substrate-binding domain-containing protein [Gemmatimonadota bacterium]
MKLRRWTIAAVLGLVALSCGDQQEALEEKKLKIAGIVFQEDQFFRLIQFGMQDAADKAGVELLLANSANKPDKEIQLVNTYIARGVDAIVISPLSAKASATALQRAKDAGIAVVTYNTTVEGDIPVTYIESDQGDLGRQTGLVARRYIEEQLGGQAKIATLAFKSQLAEQSDARRNGFVEVVGQLPGVEFVAEQDAWLPEMALKKAGDILTAHPEIDIIWSANEGGTVGSVMAVKNAGREGKVVVFGTDASQQLVEFMLAEDNILQALTTQTPFELGTKAMELAVAALKGQEVAAKVVMDGVLVARQDPDGVRAFGARLADLIALGNQ